MMKKRSAMLIVILAAWALVAACSVPSFLSDLVAGSSQQVSMETAVMQTVEARLTQASVDNLVAELTKVSLALPTDQEGGPMQSATQTAVQQTETPAPSATPLPSGTPTATLALPTITAPPSQTPIPCYAIRFIADVTVPDNTTFGAGESFVKTWRLQNAGSCAWTPDFNLVFVNGTSMGGPSSIRLNATVNPGGQVDISVSLTAPATAGSYQGNWMLRSPTGLLFGYGAKADRAFWVKINVVNRILDPTTPFDFAYYYCSAAWRNPTSSLPCPGGTNFATGSVGYTTAPRLESGYQDDEPAILLIPSDGPGGMISGTFPAFNVLPGDRFGAVIGCLYESPNCTVTFQLNYSLDGGPMQTLGSWVEVYDGNFNRLNVDLSALAGHSVQFTFMLTNNNGSSVDDRFYIMVPRINR